MNNEITAATKQVKEWLEKFNTVIEKGDFNQAIEMFADDCYWRDLVSFTWNIKTLEGKNDIKLMLEATISDIQPRQWLIEGEASSSNGITESWFTFETEVARGKGHIRLKNHQCWTLFTSMTELKGHEEKTGATRPLGVEHGAAKHRQTWWATKNQEEAELGYSQQPYCVIIGGGQGGIVLGARLKSLAVPTIIVDKYQRPGDAWRKRYQSLCLHDPVWYDHLPYLPFPDHWPVFTPKDKMGDWLECYTKIMELNYWSSTECTSAYFEPATKEWVITVNRDGETVVLRPKQLVLATGMSGKPNIPQFPGAELFQGEQHHSSMHPGAEQYRGKKCVVVGSNNSAHDICAALWENDADVTMIQRSSTHVTKSEAVMKFLLGDLYSESAVAAGITTDMADMIFASIPYKILPSFQIPVFAEIAKQDADFYQALEKAGFLLNFGEDGSGLFMTYLRRGSGYYIDVGASQLIIDGKVKLKSGTNIAQIKQHSVVLTDGTELSADLIVYATGYQSMNSWAAELISQEVADKVGPCWGLGSDTAKDPGPWEGELRNMWKPTLQEALWFHGGNLHQSRHYSKFLALQIKARWEGIATSVYG
ncbi:MAG: NAD(P)/FAD-dependent oxidoreductase [Symploca sp. SIO2D2]|nr:NAD(P)/FAD-dependent oxidoreductase [Symploca sp. SIO2D2]